MYSFVLLGVLTLVLLSLLGFVAPVLLMLLDIVALILLVLLGVVIPVLLMLQGVIALVLLTLLGVLAIVRCQSIAEKMRAMNLRAARARKKRTYGSHVRNGGARVRVRKAAMAMGAIGVATGEVKIEATVALPREKAIEAPTRVPRDANWRHDTRRTHRRLSKSTRRQCRSNRCAIGYGREPYQGRIPSSNGIG